MRKFLIGISIVGLLALTTSPSLAGGGPTEGTVDVSVTVNVLEYYRIWIDDISITLDMDPGNAWIGENDTTLHYFACIPSTDTADIDAVLTVSGLQTGVTAWFKIGSGPMLTSTQETANKICEFHITADGTYGPTTIKTYSAGAPIQHDPLYLHSNIGEGIPVTDTPVYTGTLTLTISRT